MADGEFSCFFQFNESSEEQAKAKQQYEQQLARWKAVAGANIAWLDNADRLHHWNYLNLCGGRGEGGFQGEGEGYTLECHHAIHDYACSCRNMFGRGVTEMNDIG